MYKGFYIRDGKDGETDKYIINEPFYRKLITEPEDVVMDIGAHIGTFVKRIAASVDFIVAYEPDPENFKLLLKNTEDLDNLDLVNEAVIGTDASTVDFWLSSPSIHSTVQYRGRSSIKVKATNFHNELYDVKPSLLKIDIEGGEYDLWQDLIDLPDFVKKIALEIHLNRPNWRNDLAPKLIDSLEKQGFNWVSQPRITAGNWTTNVIGTR